MTTIRVSDDGVGIPADVLAKVTASEGAATHGGVGLRNISQRLETLFGGRYTFNIDSTVGSGTVVELQIPLR
jgi:two-component system LytT family sensor kinase